MASASAAAAAAGAFACAVCGAQEATPNQDDELVCDVCGTLSQVRVRVWICVVEFGGAIMVVYVG